VGKIEPNLKFLIPTMYIVHPVIKIGQIIEGRNKLNLKRVGMIFDLYENFTNYSLNLLLSFDDNIKSAITTLSSNDDRRFKE
jgi:hypothetical protein